MKSALIKTQNRGREEMILVYPASVEIVSELVEMKINPQSIVIMGKVYDDLMACLEIEPNLISINNDPLFLDPGEDGMFSEIILVFEEINFEGINTFVNGCIKHLKGGTGTIIAISPNEDYHRIFDVINKTVSER